jgi:hypothetical protein
MSWTTRVRFQVGEIVYSILLTVLTGSDVHRSSYPMANGTFFPMIRAAEE